MSFRPLNRMWERVGQACDASPSAHFSGLTYLGEFLLKVTTLALVAAVEDEKDRLRYQQLHRLVRADGLGGWVKVLNTVLTGPPAQFLVPEARFEQLELTRHQPAGTWQFTAMAALHDVLVVLDPTTEALATQTALMQWFPTFAQIRNRTRGHGAPSPDALRALIPPLETSLRVFSDSYRLFQREWVHVRRNLSGKYRVTRLSKTSDGFAFLNKVPSEPIADGIYVDFGRPVVVEPADADPDGNDFFVPNGAFRQHQFEMLSYITGASCRVDGTPFMAPPGRLPASETQGHGELDVQGNSFGNVPAPPSDYVERDALERELVDCLLDDRHPIITLVGRGGIGKTSLALAVIRKLQQQDRFGVVVWFSARDIDLLPEGPKQVRPHVVDVGDIAAEYARLVGPCRDGRCQTSAVDLLSADLTRSPEGPYLFVFDNFETVSDPAELYLWIDTYVRSPNKVLVTTRFRDFRGDYPIEVRGMTETECRQLVDKTAARMGVTHLLTDSYRQDIFRESDGHPYVVKVLLGEVAKARRTVSIKRIMASRDDILTALFERTYTNLPPVAKRVFLTLCKWNTTLPELVLKAVFLRQENERMDVDEALEDLTHSCFVERCSAEDDTHVFVTVPLAAAVFGKSKLTVSPFKAAVEADAELLQQFGAATQCNVRHGIDPQIRRFVSFVARRAAEDVAALDTYQPILEFIALRHPPTWLHVADLYDECLGADGIVRAKTAVRHFIEKSNGDALPAWERLRDLCRRSRDVVGEVHALVEAADLPGTPFWKVSGAAHRVTTLFREQPSTLEQPARTLLVERLANVMERRLSEATATDCCRLARLCIHLHDDVRARRHVARGLDMEPQHDQLIHLRLRLFGPGLAPS